VGEAPTYPVVATQLDKTTFPTSNSESSLAQRRPLFMINPFAHYLVISWQKSSKIRMESKRSELFELTACCMRSPAILPRRKIQKSLNLQGG